MEVLIWTLLFNSACPETHKCAIGCTFLKRVVLFITSSPALSITCRFLGTPPNTHIYTFYKTVSNRFYTSVFVYVYIIYAFYLWQSGTFHTRSLHHHSIWLYFLWHPCVPPTPQVQTHTHRGSMRTTHPNTHLCIHKTFSPLVWPQHFGFVHVDVIKSTASQ